MDEITKEELLEERLIAVEERLVTQTKVLSDLTEYLTRTDPNFMSDPANFDNWTDRLEKLRQAERVEAEIKRAKKILGMHGYVVVESLGQVDAARVKQWVESKPDKDIPS